MSFSVAQNIHEDILELIFQQEFTTRGNPEQLYWDSSFIIETDSQISGKRWAKKPLYMDTGSFDENRYRPNSTLYRCLFVCKSWFPIAHRQLYRSIAIGRTSRGSQDDKAFSLLLRTLKGAPFLALNVQSLTLGPPRINIDVHQHQVDSLLRIKTELLRLCSRVRNVRVVGYLGEASTREDFQHALSELSSLESLALSATFPFFPSWANSRTFCSFNRLVELMTHWPNIHTLILPDDMIREDDDQVPSGEHLANSEVAPRLSARLQKLCMYRFQPSSGLLRSLQTARCKLQVFRCWLKLPMTPEYSVLLRECLRIWAPSLQHLTLRLARKADESLLTQREVLEDDTAEEFHQLDELQTSSRIMLPSCIAHFPNLRFLKYDMVDVAELKLLRQIVKGHKTLRALSFYTSSLSHQGPPLSFAGIPGDTTDPWTHIFELKGDCKSRGIMLENHYDSDAASDDMDDMDDTDEEDEADRESPYFQDAYDDEYELDYEDDYDHYSDEYS